MPRARIGVDIRELRKDVKTGIARYLSNFLMVAARCKSEWEFVLFGNQHSSAEAMPGGYKQVIIREGSTFWWDQVKLPQALKKEGIDLFFSPYNKGPFFAPCKAAITVHDLTPFLPFLPRQKEFFVKSGLKKIASRLMAMKADLIITDSENSRKDIMSIFGIPAEKVKVVYNGVPESFFPVKDEDILEKVRKKYALPGEYMLYVGNLLPHKNVDGLLKAYAMLPEDIRERHQIVIVAKKDENFSGVQRLCAGLKIGHRIIFIDFAGDDELHVLYSRAAIFVFPSFYEGFGLPVLEAMACGAPVLVSSAASLPEVAGDAARLFDPADIAGMSRQMAELLSNPVLRHELSAKGLARSKNFTLEKSASGIISAIESVW